VVFLEALDRLVPLCVVLVVAVAGTV